MRQWQHRWLAAARNENVQALLVALATAVGAEFKINPFYGDYFRIGLGVSTFLCFLLFMRGLPPVKTGILTGIVNAVFQHSAAAGMFYVVFAIGFSFIGRSKRDIPPLLLGGWVSAVDLVSNLTELSIRGAYLGAAAYHLNDWLLLAAVAVVRSYFVIGIYSSIKISQMRVVHAEQEKRMEQMLSVGSGLYGETFYLRKSIDEIEGIAASSFELYRQLKEANLSGCSGQALRIAQQIHEVKKDSQRILAGLSKLYASELGVQMNVTEILQSVVKGNQKYGEMLGKRIGISVLEEVSFTTPHYIPLLTVLNNLVANAMEAIEGEGTVLVHAYVNGRDVLFAVSDTGPGIAEPDLGFIFEPGFTTKFSAEGVASTGIGLSHVRDIVHSFGGGVEATSSETGGARFVVRIPMSALA
ncbi:sensor histidine kinase [Cohnella sp. CFH 77786]|uniref:sensor histidine kinase n=1 Tax=Cohnella sp. CFH 77786 TaxID=2662265 RepID=UPI002102014F|nr:sensor histidine kinase [Cohnella sp. CFH 77786]